MVSELLNEELKYISTAIQNFAVSKNFLDSSRLHLFDQKYSRNSNIVKYYLNLKYKFSILIFLKRVFIPVMKKWIWNLL